MTGRPVLTFGVELEFVIAILPSSVPDPDPDDPRQATGILETPVPNIEKIALKHRDHIDYKIHAAIAMAITNALHSIGVPAHAVFQTNETIPDPTSASAQDHLHGWEVKRDTSVFPPELEDDHPQKVYDWYSVELASPAFHAVDVAFQEILLVCQMLPHRFRVNVNSSCGLHVHVGNGADGLALREVQNLMALLWTFEPQIHMLHPSGRTSEGAALFCRSLRGKRKYFDRGLLKWVMLTDAQAVARIYAMQSVGELVEWLAKRRFYHAYKLENLVDDEEEEERKGGTKRTVEFRQHEGTLDGERVVAWARTVIALVDFARNVDTAAITALLIQELGVQETAPEGGRNLVELLQLIGEMKTAEFYRQWVKEHREAILENLLARRIEREKRKMED